MQRKIISINQAAEKSSDQASDLGLKSVFVGETTEKIDRSPEALLRLLPKEIANFGGFSGNHAMPPSLFESIRHSIASRIDLALRNRPCSFEISVRAKIGQDEITNFVQEAKTHFPGLEKGNSYVYTHEGRYLSRLVFKYKPFSKIADELIAYVLNPYHWKWINLDPTEFIVVEPNVRLTNDKGTTSSTFEKLAKNHGFNLDKKQVFPRKKNEDINGAHWHVDGSNRLRTKQLHLKPGEILSCSFSSEPNKGTRYIDIPYLDLDGFSCYGAMPEDLRRIFHDAISIGISNALSASENQEAINSYVVSAPSNWPSKNLPFFTWHIANAGPRVQINHRKGKAFEFGAPKIPEIFPKDLTKSYPFLPPQFVIERRCSS